MNQQNTDTLNNDEYEELTIQILNFYKNGKYSKDENVKSQTNSHRQEKKRLNDALRIFFQNDPEKKDNFKRYLPTLKKMMYESLETVQDKRHQELLELRKENIELKEKQKLMNEGQDNSKCGLCHYKTKEFCDNFKNNYIIQNEDVISFQVKNKSLLQKNHSLKDALNNRDTILNELQEENLTLQRDKQEMQNKLDDRGQPDSKKIKKLKKEIKKLKILLIQNKDESSSSDEESD